ncbi:hypothetical protein E7T09_04560 [Deinococcus sp. KSM4-11]|uniref:hypothetical protein n=1 Tax=Deinococcus sp. KSM4-11 TaxID=2568654 RepID=UPI0010A3A495|nr:hypothetical protein [Deinococcus sp. KSM4-11]THF88483.1 hypothetical protein E7T09_04560 [Deinococcus sp. KSM4-11]
MTATRKFLEKVRGLFPSAGETVPPEVEATPSPAPIVFTPPASVIDARPDPRVAIAGPSPLMVDAYRDLHATAERLAGQATRGLEISPGARRLYGLLVLCAVGNARSRGLSRLPDVAELHLPAELLALILEVNRSTVWRWAQEIGEDVDVETGEIRGHQLAVRWDHKTAAAPIAARGSVEAQQKRAKASGKGKGTAARTGVSDGLLWAVSLTGPRCGLRVSHEALKHEWRDLCADSVAASKNKGTAEGLRTVWALKNAGLQQSLEGLKATEGAEIAVRWTVNPGFKSTPPLNMTVAARSAALGAVWDVQSVRGLRRHEQAAAVDAAAHYLAALYGDSGSVSMYHWVLWRLLRLDTVGVNLWDVVLLTMDQVRGDLAAGDCTNAGALLMWRLKAIPEGGGQSLWAQLKDAYQLAPRGWSVA